MAIDVHPSHPTVLIGQTGSGEDLARAALVGVVNANVNRVVEVATELFRLLLCKSVSGNNYYDQHGHKRLDQWLHTLESLIDIDSILGARLEIRDVTLRLTERHRSLV